MRDDGLLKVFGFDHPDLERIERLPVNTTCFYCDEPIRQNEAGFSHIAVFSGDVATRVYEHRACFLRGIFGSVAHIEQRCSCFVKGSHCGDPEGMTQRQAAEAAVEAYERINHAGVKEWREIWKRDREQNFFECPTCHMRSHNLNDIENRYCGNCHKFAEEQ